MGVSGGLVLLTDLCQSLNVDEKKFCFYLTGSNYSSYVSCVHLLNQWLIPQQYVMNAITTGAHILAKLICYGVSLELIIQRILP
jgi:hypothetical protein